MIDRFKVIVSGFVFNESGELLIIRRSLEEESFPGMLAIPGGTVEAPMQGGLQANVVEDNLVREIKEETDVDVRITDWMESSVIAKEDSAKLYMFFRCAPNGSVFPRTSDETPEVFWARPSEISLHEATPALAHYIQSVSQAS